MPRIGTVIRDVHRRPGADALPGHLEDRYGIRVTAMTRLTAGVFRVDRAEGPPWVARLGLAARPLARIGADAEVLRFLERQGFPAERCAHAEPVSTLGGRAVLVTGYVAGTRPPLSPATRRLAGYRRHTGLTADELDRLEGVLWIRPLWLAAWQLWLVCVSAKVHQAFVPDPAYIAALASQVRASSQREPV